jgi:tetratricopeptide (TPR) repeat protein
MTTTHIERARFFMEQERWPEAVRELQAAAAANPDVAYTHGLLALCLSAAKQPREALRAAQHAVHLGPDEDFAHFSLASVLQEQDRLTEAERAVREAIRLEGENEHYYSLLGSILLQQGRWQDALNAADAGLRLNSEDVTCANLRAMALVKLGRQDHAHRALDTALSYEPENAFTHANRGFAMLHQNRPKEAFDHFREALRLDPTNEYAREGVIQALRARNPVYRVLLVFFLWMSRLSPGARTGLIIGMWFGHRIVRETARQNPQMAPYLAVVSGAYLLFVFLCWTAEPLFDLLLRLDPVGRMALSREKIVASNWVGTLLFGALGCFGVWLVTRSTTTGLAALIFATMILPAAAAFDGSNRKRPWVKVYAGVLGLIGAVVILQEATSAGKGLDLLGLYLLGFVAFTWIAGLMSSR